MYLPYINQIISALLFEEQCIPDILKSKDYHLYFRKKVFNLLLLSSVVKLHTMYAGIYAKKLEDLYLATDLKDRSIKKLKSISWRKKCKGIREVSEMNLPSSYTLIYPYIGASNKVLRLEALTGLVRLKGFEGLKLLKDYKVYINDWIQINMLYALKNKKEEAATDLAFLLHSSNESLVTFGLRIVGEFNLVQYREIIDQMASSQLHNKNRQQILLTQNKLKFL